jgi:hypothetical protein
MPASLLAAMSYSGHVNKSFFTQFRCQLPVRISALFWSRPPGLKGLETLPGFTRLATEVPSGIQASADSDEKGERADRKVMGSAP